MPVRGVGIERHSDRNSVVKKVELRAARGVLDGRLSTGGVVMRAQAQPDATDLPGLIEIPAVNGRHSKRRSSQREPVRI